MSTHATTVQPSYLVDTGSRKGLMAWLTSTDHKRIGLLYLYSMISFFFVGVGIGFVMRLVQLTRFQHLITAETYNALFTVHGVIMIFLFVVPGLPAVFGNFFLPILIGARTSPSRGSTWRPGTSTWRARPSPSFPSFSGAAPPTPAGPSTCPSA